MTDPATSPGARANPPTDAPTRRRRGLTVLWIVLGAVLTSSCIVVPILFRMFVYEPFRIPSSAMSPTLFVGDQFLLDKRPRAAPPARGEVVLFAYPRDPTRDFVSRVVTVAGDRVVVAPDGAVTLNGVALPRCALGAWTLASAAGGQPRALNAFLERNGGREYVVLAEPEPPATGDEVGCTEAQPCEVPAGRVLTLGDNRNNAFDGRYWGFLPIGSVRGRVRWLFRAANDAPAGRNFRDVQDPPVLPPELAARRRQCQDSLAATTPR